MHFLCFFWLIFTQPDFSFHAIAYFDHQIFCKYQREWLYGNFHFYSFVILLLFCAFLDTVEICLTCFCQPGRWLGREGGREHCDLDLCWRPFLFHHCHHYHRIWTHCAQDIGGNQKNAIWPPFPLRIYLHELIIL